MIYDAREHAKNPGILGRIRRALTTGTGRMLPGMKAEKNNYQRFQEILTLNNKSLELIVDLEEVLQGRAVANLDSLARRIRTMCADIATMAEDLIHITGGRHARLLEFHRDIGARIDSALPPERKPEGRLVAPIYGSRLKDYRSIGTKMANLAETWWKLVGVDIPEGFVITTAAFAAFLTHNDLWEPVDRLEYLAGRNPLALEAESREVVRRIESGAIPKDLEKEVASAVDDLLKKHGTVLFAVRSSAIAEDSEASHAGIYRTELSVPGDEIFAAYRKVLASSYSPKALLYRAWHNLPPVEGSMAVGCMAMVNARCSGILFTRDYQEPSADRIVLSVSPGLSDKIASGEEDALEVTLEGPDFTGAKSAAMSGEETYSLAKTARMVEKIFGGPQDIEWAIDKDGSLIILQSRPLVLSRKEGSVAQDAVGDKTPILRGGMTACRGAASGPVFIISQGTDPTTIPEGSVVVARKAWPSLVSSMNQISAIISEVGSPTGHMAILAREASLPCIVGMPEVLSTLHQDQLVTVDARTCTVYEGILPVYVPDPGEARFRGSGDHGSEEEILSRVSPLLVPLNLTDPDSPEFKPENCRSMHDMLRFIHESVFGAMFHFGDLALREQDKAVLLQAPLPFPVLVYDIGGAIAEGETRSGKVPIEGIVSEPMRAFLNGLTDPRVRWNQPRPVSTKGFLSVVGESLAGPPAEQRDLGRTSFAVASDKYLNFSTKAGYHFSTVDAYCGPNLNMNYIQFRFMGGGASEERRARRVRFLSKVLSHMEFSPREKGELLVARVNKYDSGAILEYLTILGRLTLVARQLDMLMDSDASPVHFAERFIADKMEFF